ncbi:hypothetical protein KBD08_02630 [Candidatus Babeliales bacterium]|nr:hypothetical protein [Candidatus Babeliales bacterium]
MKKLFITCMMIMSIQILQADNLCWGYPTTVSRFSQQTIGQLTNCNCECWLYPHTKGSNSPYICDVCGHKRTPEYVGPDKKLQKKYHSIRFTNQSTTQNKPNAVFTKQE